MNGLFGDSVWLVATDGQQNVTTFIDDVHFSGIDEGTTLGRIPDGHGRLTPQEQTTLGSANVAARVGSLVISEVQYNPGTIAASTLAIYPPLTQNDLEFVEVYNASQSDMNVEGWRIRGGIDHTFDAATIPANGTLLVLPFNPGNPRNAARLNAFRAHHGLDDQTVIVGGYGGQLNNSDDRITLQRPDTPPNDEPNRIPFFQEDEVLYDDLAPWPKIDANSGFSLHRIGVNRYGNAAGSWRADAATPGRVLFTIPGDFNEDGIVNADDIDLLSAQVRSATLDLSFDLNSDQKVDQADRRYLVHTILGTTFGDTNLDGVFNDQDLVAIFRSEKRDDGIPLNSGWIDGDFNGDGEMTTSDLVLAFQDGRFTEGNAAAPLRPSLHNNLRVDLVDSYFENSFKKN